MEELVQVLFSKGLKANGRDEYGNPPLHLAASFGYIYVVDNLLQNDADPEAIDGDGLTALDRIEALFEQAKSDPEKSIFNEGTLIFCRNAISHAIEEQNSH